MIATLPMYDWPEVHRLTERYWRVLRNVLSDYGFEPPEKLAQESDPHVLWQDSRLVFGQTCGLPFVRELKGRVTLLGSPTYSIDCGRGNYCSILIARPELGRVDPFSAPDLRFAYNDARSQSGLAAWLSGVRRKGNGLPSGLVPVHTGSHRASIRAVAEGRADLAAIDAVTFELACRHEPATRQVIMLARTPETPGLPYIASAALAGRKDELCAAVEDAIGELDEETSEGLLIACFKRREATDYDGIEADWQAVRAAGLDRPFVS